MGGTQRSSPNNNKKMIFTRNVLRIATIFFFAQLAVTLGSEDLVVPESAGSLQTQLDELKGTMDSLNAQVSHQQRTIDQQQKTIEEHTLHISQHNDIQLQHQEQLVQSKGNNYAVCDGIPGRQVPACPPPPP